MPEDGQPEGHCLVDLDARIDLDLHTLDGFEDVQGVKEELDVGLEVHIHDVPEPLVGELWRCFMISSRRSACSGMTSAIVDLAGTAGDME
jgi:hypothetical protein